MGNNCITLTSVEQKIADDILKLYPEACQRAGFNPTMCCEWIGGYITDNNKALDFRPDAKTLVNWIEKKRNMDGKSFLYIPEKITYNLPGQKQQTYTVIHDKIFNKDGKDVFPEDSKHRRKIFANLAVQQGRAVVVNHKNKQYVVNNRNQIISVTSGDMMQWGDENGDRKEILRLAQIEFKKKETTTNTTPGNISSYNFFSGGATGSDTEWGNALRALGGNVKDFTVKDYDLLPKKEKDKIEKEYYEAAAFIHRRPTNATSYSGKLVRRDMMQADNADAIFAIVRTDPNDGSILGGTAYATARGWLRGIPVYYFDQGDGKWYETIYEEDGTIGNISMDHAPALTPRAAVVGTREINDAGKQAIKDVINNSFSNSNNPALSDNNPGLSENNPALNIEAAFEEMKKKLSPKLKKQEGRGGWSSVRMLDRRHNGAPIIHVNVYNSASDIDMDYYYRLGINGSMEKASKWGSESESDLKWEAGSSEWDEVNDFFEALGSQPVAQKVELYQGYWTRDEIAKQTDKVFLFGDNTYDRTVTHHVPTSTQAVIRGLPNAIGIDTKRNRATGNNSYFSDDEFDEFKAQVDSAIKKAKASGKTIVIPADGIGTGKAMLEEKAPKCFAYLQSELNKLKAEEPDLDNSENNATFAQETNNIMSSSLVSAIETGEWTKETLNEFDKLINDIENGNIVYERVPQRLSGSYNKGGRANVAAWLLSRGNEGSNAEESRSLTPGEKYDRDKRNQVVQEKKLKAWAKAAGLWADNSQDVTKGMEHLEERDGGEAQIYVKDKDNIRKLISTDYFITPQFMSDRIALHNMFSSATMVVKGFTQDKDGNLLYVVDQPFIEGTKPTMEEIKDFADRIGFDKLDKDKGNTYISRDGAIYLSDLHDENVIKTPSGDLVIIDMDIRLNTPDLNHKGTYVVDNRLTKVNPALEKFKLEVDMLSGYYEGGGAVLTDKYPNLTKELDDKLADYFLGDGQLTIEDYRELYKIMHPSSSSPSNAASSSAPQDETPEGLIRGQVRFNLSPEEIAAAQRKQEAENKPKPERPKSAAYESAMKTNDSRVAQFKRTFSPQQIKDRGAMISNIFSSIIEEHLYDLIDAQLDIIDSDTATEQEKDAAKIELNRLKDPINGRQHAAEDMGIPVIIDEIKQHLEWDLEAASEEVKPLWQNTLDFFEELFNTQATLDIEEREGIRIIGLETAKQTATDDENDAQDDGDDEVGHVVSGSDGWSFQVRYTNPFDSLSRRVRNMLYEIARPESEKDDLGQNRNYPMGQIYASLLSYLAKNMQDADDFLSIDRDFVGQDRWGNDITENTYPNGYPTFPVLEEMKKVYPWVQQIIDRLTDDYLNPDWNTNLRYPSTGGSMASQFYTNFRKAYIPYGKVQLGDGKFGITPLNYEMEERAQYDKLEANYNNRMILSSHSIYGSDGKISKENAEWLKQKLESVVADMDRNDYPGMPELMEYQSLHPDEEVITAEDIQQYNDFMDTVRMLLQSFGIDATQDSVAAYLLMDDGKTLKDMLGDLGWIATTVSKVDDDKIDSFNYILDTRDRYGSNLWSHFFDGRGLITNASYMQSFYDSASKKTKYSYSADNYLMKTFRGACMGTLEQRRAYIDEHFGKFEWFRNQRTGEWRNKWLEYWYNYPGEQKEIPYRNVDNVTDYSGDEVKIRQYSKWEPDDIWQVQNRSYEPDKDNKTAFYLAPIFSDSPMSMTVKGPKMSMDELLYGTNENGEHRQGALVQLVNQELWRIGYVQDRAQAIKEGRVTAIANFDGKRGQQFCFLPELNSYIFEDTGETFLERMIRLKAEKATMAAIEASEIQAIQDIINAKMGEYQTENGAHYNPESPLKAEQYYNMVYANAAIIQMTTVDLAFYKDDTDFQKRFKEVYAGGIQLNTNSKYGKKTENIILLADDIITSPSYDKISAIIDGSKALSSEDKARIKSTFQDINVADAQAFRSMHSFRSVLDMMGNWTDEMENALNHFKQGEWSREDFDIIYQTIKPFVYSVIERNDGFGSSILVPQQNKNSEICALMMYDLITNGLNDSPVYRALSRFMEETVDGDGNQLIDMVQYESAGKVGNQGVINISFNPNKVMSVIENGVTVGGKDYEFYSAYRDGKYLDNTLENAEENYRAIKADLDEKLYHKEISQDDYNKVMQYLRPTEEEVISMLEQAVLITNPDGTKGINTEVVHTIPFDNYYQQQPTPEHHIDAEATFGSQTRNIIVADLPDDMVLTLTGKGGKKRLLGKTGGKGAIVDFYYELLNENLIEDFFGVGNKKGLKGVFESKEALRDAVTEIVRGNPKYGRDFAEALQLDENGEFVLSPNSPTIFPLMQEIITSFFKNRITKQTINGAALIQAAGIGLDENLKLEFDKDGNLLGAHCLMPLTSKRFFEPLLETQIINGQEVKVLSPEKLKKAGLDRAIGYRIPTENKSSIMPLIIDGFTPLQNGSAIVLPAEITNIAGSDFDVDKMFIMLLSFYVQNYDMRRAREVWANQQQVIKEIKDIFYNSNLLDEVSEADPQEFREWFEEHKEEFLLESPIIRKIEYDFDKSPKENGRKARNNMIIQMMYEILISKAGSESVMNPQGFPDVKHAAKLTRILTDQRLLNQLEQNTSGGNTVLPSSDQIIAEFMSVIQERYPEKYDEYKTAVLKMTTEQIQQAYIQAVTAGNKDEAIKLLLDSSTKDLEKFIKQYSAPESPVFPQTFAHSHARNMAGANQIGIYAIQGSMDAKYQRANVRLREEQRFTVNGKLITNVDVSDDGKRLKNVGQMIGASADNGKDPNLSDMGSTTKTAPMIGYMLRLGLSHLEAALIINQNHMKDSMYSSKSRYWEDMLGKNPLATPTGNVTSEMLIKGLISPFELTAAEDKAIAALCYRILMQHEAQEYLTQISRADSPNGSIANSYAKARIQRYKVDLFQAKMGQKDFPFVRITEALSNTAVNPAASEEEVREQLKGQSMGLLHGMYALGINSFNSLVNPYFFGAQQWFDDEIVKPILYNLNERKGNDMKEEIVNNIYTSYITYTLSSSSLFGNEESSTMKSKRDYYLETFPSDYQKIIQENEDIRELLSSILQVKQFGSRKRVILQDVGSLSKGQKQDVQRRFDSLMYSENPVARNLAKDLFVYSYFDNGLQFTHDSFSHLFTTEFLTNFPMYNEALLELNDRITPEEEENFIAQFLVTYPEAAYNVNDIITKANVNDKSGTIVIDLNDKKLAKRMVNEVMSPNPQFEGINVYPYIQYNGDVYILDKNLFEQYPGSPVYHKVDKYQTFSRLPLFSKQMSVAQMAQEFSVRDENPQGGQSTGPAAPEAPMAHNEGSGNPNIAPDGMYDAFDDMDDYDLPDDVEPDAPQSKSDNYQAEGEGELKDPFCVV